MPVATNISGYVFMCNNITEGECRYVSTFCMHEESKDEFQSMLNRPNCRVSIADDLRLNHYSS